MKQRVKRYKYINLQENQPSDVSQHTNETCDKAFVGMQYSLFHATE